MFIAKGSKISGGGVAGGKSERRERVEEKGRMSI